MTPIIAPIIALALDAIAAFREGRMEDGAAAMERGAALARDSDLSHGQLNAEIDEALKRGGHEQP